MVNPIVEMDGDEMTRVLWQIIKDDLLTPFVDLNMEYYDLGLPKRDETRDKITWEAAEAIKKHHVGVKCATITPNKQRVEEYNLHEMWKSPNGTIRAVLDGTVFRAPILTSCIKPVVKNWKKPITIARHAYGDVYRGTEYRVKDTSIKSFARSCFEYALSTKQPIWFATKDTISKQYDQTFKLLFQEIFEAEYKAKFDAAGITYFYTLIDDAVARVMRSEGGFIWACKNYDGDVMSDMVSTAFGSLAMMTSVLVSPDGNFEYEAAHGTVTKHYYRYRDEGKMTSTNPVATIFAWSGALRKRGELDGTQDLVDFANKLEKATIDTIEGGVMTKDLTMLAEGVVPHVVDSKEFIKAIASKL